LSCDTVVGNEQYVTAGLQNVKSRAWWQDSTALLLAPKQLLVYWAFWVWILFNWTIFTQHTHNSCKSTNG